MTKPEAPADQVERALSLVRRIAAREPWQVHYGHSWEDEAAEIVALSQPSPGDGERGAIVAWLRERAASCRQAASDIGDDDDEALIAWVTRAETYDFAADHLASAAGER